MSKSLKVVNIHGLPTKQAALDVVDSIRRDIETGEIVGFACVAVEPGDETRVYIGTSRPVTRLRMMGMLSQLDKWFWSGE